MLTLWRKNGSFLYSGEKKKTTGQHYYSIALKSKNEFMSLCPLDGVLRSKISWISLLPKHLKGVRSQKPKLKLPSLRSLPSANLNHLCLRLCQNRPPSSRNTLQLVSSMFSQLFLLSFLKTHGINFTVNILRLVNDLLFCSLKVPNSTYTAPKGAKIIEEIKEKNRQKAEVGLFLPLSSGRSYNIRTYMTV